MLLYADVCLDDEPTINGKEAVHWDERALFDKHFTTIIDFLVKPVRPYLTLASGLLATAPMPLLARSIIGDRPGPPAPRTTRTGPPFTSLAAAAAPKPSAFFFRAEPAPAPFVFSPCAPFSAFVSVALFFATVIGDPNPPKTAGVLGDSRFRDRIFSPTLERDMGGVAASEGVASDIFSVSSPCVGFLSDAPTEPRSAFGVAPNADDRRFRVDAASSNLCFCAEDFPAACEEAPFRAHLSVVTFSNSNSKQSRHDAT